MILVTIYVREQKKKTYKLYRYNIMKNKKYVYKKILLKFLYEKNMKYVYISLIQYIINIMILKIVTSY